MVMQVFVMVLMHRAIDHVATTPPFHIADSQQPQGLFHILTLADLPRVDAQDFMIEIVAIFSLG